MTEPSANAPTYSLVILDEAFEQLVAMRKQTFKRVSQSLDLLTTMPYLGKAYDPVYDESLKPLPIRTLFVPQTTKLVFYLVDERIKRIVIFFVGDARSDPLSRHLSLALRDVSTDG